MNIETLFKYRRISWDYSEKNIFDWKVENIVDISAESEYNLFENIEH